MKPITLPIADLKSAIVGLGKVIPSRPSLPVLGHVYVERTKDGTVAISATDLDCYGTARFATNEKHDATSLLVPFDGLSKTVKSCDRKDLLLIEPTSPKTLQLKHLIGGQLIEQSLATLPVEEFPEIPSVDGLLAPIPNDARSAILQAFDCSSTDPTRMVLNGAYLDVSVPKSHHVIGTDGRQLFSSNSFTLPLKESLIVPTHRFLEWKEFTADGSWVLRVAKAKKDEASMFELRSDRWSFISRAREGNYPNWRQVVPTPASFQTEIVIDPQAVDEIVALIQRLPCHDPINMGVGLEVTKRQVELLARADREGPWSRFPIPAARVRGNDVRIHLNRDLFAKALRYGLCKIEIIDSLSPLKFSEGGRLIIVMPLRPDAVRGAPVSNPPSPTPAAAAQQPTPPPAEPKEESSMPRNTNGNGHTNGATKAPTATTNEKSAVETALAQIEIVKGDFRNAIAGLNKLGENLKQVQREQKTSEKEISSVRHTLRSLQTVRI